ASADTIGSADSSTNTSMPLDQHGWHYRHPQGGELGVEVGDPGQVDSDADWPEKVDRPVAGEVR
ncbi:hypothetical protein, partial [Actinoplanes sp. NPDC026623]|uniref:hypothetical protein n=1 Tax=Actinoplanes sp. NPDC026623 TaxID=3155610 RepID=UPI0033C530FC